MKRNASILAVLFLAASCSSDDPSSKVIKKKFKVDVDIDDVLSIHDEPFSFKDHGSYVIDIEYTNSSDARAEISQIENAPLVVEKLACDACCWQVTSEGGELIHIIPEDFNIAIPGPGIITISWFESQIDTWMAWDSCSDGTPGLKKADAVVGSFTFDDNGQVQHLRQYETLDNFFLDVTVTPM